MAATARSQGPSHTLPVGATEQLQDTRPPSPWANVPAGGPMLLAALGSGDPTCSRGALQHCRLPEGVATPFPRPLTGKAAGGIRCPGPSECASTPATSSLGPWLTSEGPLCSELPPDTSPSSPRPCHRHPRLRQGAQRRGLGGAVWQGQEPPREPSLWDQVPWDTVGWARACQQATVCDQLAGLCGPPPGPRGRFCPTVRPGDSILSTPSPAPISQTGKERPGEVEGQGLRSSEETEAGCMQGTQRLWTWPGHSARDTGGQDTRRWTRARGKLGMACLGPGDKWAGMAGHQLQG